MKRRRKVVIELGGVSIPITYRPISLFPLSSVPSPARARAECLVVGLLCRYVDICGKKIKKLNASMIKMNTEINIARKKCAAYSSCEP